VGVVVVAAYFAGSAVRRECLPMPDQPGSHGLSSTYDAITTVDVGGRLADRSSPLRHVSWESVQAILMVIADGT
jgi:hypothetical protein